MLNGCSGRQVKKGCRAVGIKQQQRAIQNIRLAKKKGLCNIQKNQDQLQAYPMEKMFRNQKSF